MQGFPEQYPKSKAVFFSFNIQFYVSLIDTDRCVWTDTAVKRHF